MIRLRAGGDEGGAAEVDLEVALAARPRFAGGLRGKLVDGIDGARCSGRVTLLGATARRDGTGRGAGRLVGGTIASF